MDHLIFFTGAFIFHCVKGDLLKNVALLKPTQSSSKYGGNISPSRANDGNYEGHWHLSPSCFATGSLLDPWWMVDLQAIYKIKSFMVLNRLDCCPHRLKDFTVETFLQNPVDVPAAVASHCYFYSGYPPPGIPETRDCDTMVVGRYFRLRMNPAGSDKVLSVCEVEVYSPSAFICSRYTGHIDARMSHYVSLSVNSTTDCLNACVDFGMCLGFNLKLTEDSECQIVTQISGQPELAQGWKFYQYEQC